MAKTASGFSGFEIRSDLSVLRELRVRRDSGIRAVALLLQASRRLSRSGVHVPPVVWLSPG